MASTPWRKITALSGELAAVCGAPGVARAEAMREKKAEVDDPGRAEKKATARRKTFS
jgi:hypothetical protein